MTTLQCTSTEELDHALHIPTNEGSDDDLATIAGVAHKLLDGPTQHHYQFRIPITSTADVVAFLKQLADPVRHQRRQFVRVQLVQRANLVIDPVKPCLATMNSTFIHAHFTQQKSPELSGTWLE